VQTLKGLNLSYHTNVGRTILSRHTNAMDLESGVDRLQDPNWQLHVQGVLYRYMTLGVNTDDASLLREAKALLQECEQRERLAWLELAVWKAACISRATRTELDSKMNMKTVHDMRTVNKIFRIKITITTPIVSYRFG
jgi:hypothetical protein